MKHKHNVSAGAADCLFSMESQPTAPGNSPQNQLNPAIASSSQPLKGRDLGAGECYSPEAEAQVLGCILLNAQEAFSTLSTAGITTAHFHDLRNRALFKIMQKLFKDHQSVDLLTVIDRFSKNEYCADPVVERCRIAEFPDLVPTFAQLSIYIEQLVEQYHRRVAIDMSRRLLAIASDKTAPAGQLVEDAEGAFAALRRISAPRKLTVRSAGELLREEIRQDENLLGDRLLARGQSLTLLGAGGIGKSRLLLQLAGSCITGRNFLGLRVHQPDLRWLIFQAENTKSRVQQDLERLRTWLGSEWPRLEGRLFLHTIEKPQDAFVQMDQKGVISQLSRVIQEIDPDVVCFDPLNCFGMGDLNRDGDMRATCLALTQLCAEGRADRAIIVLHHALTGKAGAARATGYDRSSFGRNSKLLQAWTRGQINLAPAHGDDNGRIVVSCGKCSNGEEFKPFAIRLNRETMIYEEDFEFDYASWQRQLADGPEHEPEDDLLEICAQPQTRKDTVTKLITRGHSRTSAYRLIEQALEEGLVRLEGKLLHRVDPE